MEEIKPLTVEDVRDFSHRVATEFAEFFDEEPVPDFDTRYEGKLESCLRTPFQTFEGEDPYPSLAQKCAILFYLMIKNHPFINGNKRIAVVTLLFFMLQNGFAPLINYGDMYRLAKAVAMSDRRDMEATLADLEKLFQKTMIPREEWLKSVEAADHERPEAA